MPMAPPRPCAAPGCGQLVTGRDRRCPDHKRAARRASDAKRGGSTARLYSYRWQQARVVFLKTNPWCKGVDDGRRCNQLATEVDHIVPHRGDLVKFWDRSNWQGLCKSHHSRKTATEDGGLGGAGRVSGT